VTTANFEGFAFKLPALTTGPGSTIPTGTTLERVILTTRDLLSPGVPTNDGFYLTTGESANILINGSLVSTLVPSFRTVLLNTDQGTFSAQIFTIGQDSYALPLTGNTFAASTITAPFTLSTGGASATSLNPQTYGLQPEGANTYVAQAFSTQDFNGSPYGVPDYSTVTTVTLQDTDLIRGNGEALFSPYTETLTTIQFSDGTILGGVETLQRGGYSGYVTSFSFLFDTGALAASGHTIGDVVAVLNSFAYDHNLTWAEAGFTLSAGPITDGGGDDVPPPPPDPALPNVINGTSRNDVLTGTSGRDIIRGFDRNDTMTGGDGDDYFVFGTDSRSGRRSVDEIRDFTAGEDKPGAVQVSCARKTWSMGQIASQYAQAKGRSRDPSISSQDHS
jgi:Ca2+-binding RTX toxin-like protein